MNSLHTKYRPSTFSEVLGQDAVIKSLDKVTKANRAHTFLLTGPSGCGKTTIARLLAKQFAGEKATAVNIEEFPAAEKSGADAVRDVLRRTLYRAIGASPVKAIIIDECHRLSGTAWDVLLKPTEEPSPHVYWFFCTTEPGKVPKAMLTRCARYDLKPVSEELLLELLIKVCDEEKLDIADEVIEAIAENSGGSPRQALVFLEECQYCESGAEARQKMRSAGQSKEIIDLCRWLVSGKAQSWTEAIKYLKGLEGIEAESCRIVVVNYIAKALTGTKSDAKAVALLGLLECFERPYASSDKQAPLMLSISRAIGLDR